MPLKLTIAPIAQLDLLRPLKVALLLPEQVPPNALHAQLEDSVPLQVIVNVKSVLPVQPVLEVLLTVLTILVPIAQKELTKLEPLLVPAPIAQLDLPRPLLVALLLPEREPPTALHAQLEDSVLLLVIDSVPIAVKENPVLEVLPPMPILACVQLIHLIPIVMIPTDVKMGVLQCRAQHAPHVLQLQNLDVPVLLVLSTHSMPMAIFKMDVKQAAQP